MEGGAHVHQAEQCVKEVVVTGGLRGALAPPGLTVFTFASQNSAPAHTGFAAAGKTLGLVVTRSLE